MFKHLLVPLDGSRMAEAALAPALYLAQATGARLTLLHVMEHDPPDAVHGEPHLQTLDAAYTYLDATAARLPPYVLVDMHAHPNPEHDVARSIAAHAAELGVDLIVICTHGQSSLRRWLFGTIAQQVISQARLPVLVVRPVEPEQPPFAIQRILAPLDGDPAHEAGLAVAAGIAAATHAALDLLVVIPTLATLPLASTATARLLPAATRAALDISEESATLYLAGHAQTLGKAGITCTTGVRRGDPIALIAQEAAQRHANLIVMATHGKSHMGAFWAGSVAPLVTERTHLPLILVPALPR